MENNNDSKIEEVEEACTACEPLPSEVKTCKKTKVWIIAAAVTLCVALVSVLLVLLLGDDESSDPIYIDYTVTVVDGVGVPVSNVMVKFTSNDGTTKTKITDKDGKAVLKNALEGDYQVTLEAGLSEIVLVESEFSLTKDISTLKVRVKDPSKIENVYGDVDDGAFAYSVVAGEYDILCNQGEKQYVVFHPQTLGVYKFSFTSSDEDMIIAYYGMPMYVQSNHVGDGEYDGKSFELVIQDAQTPYVIGLLATENAEAKLKIERLGDAPFDPNYVAYTQVSAKEEFREFEIPAGKSLVSVDIANPNLTLTLGDDGYYYTNTGKLVYLRITSGVDAYLGGASLAFLAGYVDSNIGMNIGGYVYGENGEFIGKYSYNSMIESYMPYCDENGVYPMTEELAECIKIHGENVGWWAKNTETYLFKNTVVADGNEWLFLACVAE